MKPIIRNGQIAFMHFLLFAVFFVNPALAQETPAEKAARIENEIQQLRIRLDTLQQQLTGLTNQDSIAPPVNKEDEALLRELEADLNAGGDQPSETGQPQVSATTSMPRQQLFQGMNPNISTIGTLFGSGSGLKGLGRKYDLGLEEVEFAFLAAVDPYAKADFYVGFGAPSGESLIPEAEPGEPGAGGGFEPEVEEAYLTVLTLPFSMQLKAGKFRAKFGKINETHPHAHNFLGLPLVYQNFLGEEGLVDQGVGLKWLLPNSKFYQELSLQVLTGPSESPSFVRADGTEFLYLAHLNNFFDLSDNTTLELGLAGTSGPHNQAGDRTNIYGADLTIKWKPLRYNRFKSFEWQTEALVSHRKEPDGDIDSFGLFSHLRYQIAKRWFLGYLFDYTEFPVFTDYHHSAHSAIAQFLATEFQKVEVQLQYNTGNFFEDYLETRIRAVFVIGAHGAHQY